MCHPKQLGHILVVDDDAEVRRLLGRYLADKGYRVSALRDGQGLERHLRSACPDLLVLDLMLPGRDGLEILRSLPRRTPHLPVIILSGRGQVEDKVTGLDRGADDYLAKPFSPRELLARIRSVLRPRREGQGPDPAPEPIFFGPYTLDLERQELRCGQAVVPLTTGEHRLLTLLAQRPGHVLDRDHLFRRLKGYERARGDRSIDVGIVRLRQKIEPAPRDPAYIRTVPGRGYLFTPDGERP